MNDLIEQETKAISVFTVITKDDLARATACIQGIKGLQKKVNEDYDEVIEKAHRIHKDLIAKRDGYLKPLKDVEAKFKAEILVYTKRVEAEQRELERQTNEALAKMAEENKQKLLADAKATDNEWEAEVLKEKAADLKPATVDIVKKVVEQEGLSIRKTWKWRVTDESIIPRAFLSLNEQALNQAAKQESWRISGIMGIEFYEESSANVRMS